MPGDDDGAAESFLTERQERVLRLREEGLTQRAIAERLGTTASNVSAIERAGRTNVERARRTIDRMRAIRAPASLTLEAGTDLDDAVDTIYAAGDDSGVRVAHSKPELYGHLYAELGDALRNGRLRDSVGVDLTREGDVTVDR